MTGATLYASKRMRKKLVLKIYLLQRSKLYVLLVGYTIPLTQKLIQRSVLLWRRLKIFCMKVEPLTIKLKKFFILSKTYLIQKILIKSYHSVFWVKLYKLQIA